MYRTRYQIVVAICDGNLLGKVIKWKGIDIEISRSFYGEKEIDEAVAVRIMQKSTIGNLFGKEIISLAKKNGFITKENIILIDGIPHAQFVKF